MKKEIEIKQISEYIRSVLCLKTKDSNDPDPSLDHEELIFRGLSSGSYPLRPSIDRHPSTHWYNSLLYAERDLISGAQQKISGFFDNTTLPVAKLSKLQHFGIPTRMMDVTSNPLVALYFACRETSSKKSNDGEVAVFSKRAFPALNPYVNVIADTYRLIGNVNTSIDTFYYKAMKQDYCISLQYPDWEKDIANRVESFRQQVSQLYLVESYELSTRQKNQQGKYILFPNKVVRDGRKEWLVSDDLMSIDKNDKSIIKRYIIPADRKKGIMDDLNKLGINEEHLFADNIEIVFNSVREKQVSRFE